MKMLYLSEKADPFITSSDKEDAAQDFNKIDEDDDIDIEMWVLTVVISTIVCLHGIRNIISEKKVLFSKFGQFEINAPLN